MSKPKCWNCRKVLQKEGTHCAGCGACKYYPDCAIWPFDEFKAAVADGVADIQEFEPEFFLPQPFALHALAEED